MTAGVEPPGLDRALSTDERAVLLRALLDADEFLQRAAASVELPESAWSQDVRACFSQSPIRHEPPASILQRWWNLFNEEVTLVHETRNRIVHGLSVSDAEILRAQWIARHLIEITERSK
jgi:hypothetical protein